MATEVGRHAWSLPALTTREKAFVFLAADLCTGKVGFALLTHVQMAGANGVSVPECVATIRHLAPYVGYPTAAVALKQLRKLESSGDPAPHSATGGELPADVLVALTEPEWIPPPHLDIGQPRVNG